MAGGLPPLLIGSTAAFLRDGMEIIAGAPLADDNGLFWRITQHAPELLPGVSVTCSFPSTFSWRCCITQSGLLRYR
jgi:hypothetical protein